MKAVVWTKYGSADELQLKEVEKPTPGDNDVLIKVHAATVTIGDCEFRCLKFPLWLALPIRLYTGLRKPHRVTVLGQELAGEIVAVGKNVDRFKAGDPVFGTTGFNFGAYAEYIRLPAKSEDCALSIKPANMTYAEAATVPMGGLEAWHFLKRGNIQPGHKVLINGAGGSIGTIGVQLAKLFGAEVTAVDSTPKLDMLRSIGADHVIDYTQEDFAQRGAIYDVVFDVVGRHSFARSLRALKPAGIYLLANTTLSALFRGMWIGSRTSKQVVANIGMRDPEALNILKELIEAGKLKTVIDRYYPLEQTAEAHRYVETGQKTGNVVITVVRPA